MNNSKLRSVRANDLPFLIDVVENSGLLTGKMLRSMITDKLDDESSQEHWLTYETDKPIAIAYVAPERTRVSR